MKRRTMAKRVLSLLLAFLMALSLLTPVYAEGIQPTGDTGAVAEEVLPEPDETPEESSAPAEDDTAEPDAPAAEPAPDEAAPADETAPGEAPDDPASPADVSSDAPTADPVEPDDPAPDISEAGPAEADDTPEAPAPDGAPDDPATPADDTPEDDLLSTGETPVTGVMPVADDGAEKTVVFSTDAWVKNNASWNPTPLTTLKAGEKSASAYVYVDRMPQKLDSAALLQGDTVVVESGRIDESSNYISLGSTWADAEHTTSCHSVAIGLLQNVAAGEYTLRVVTEDGDIYDIPLTVEGYVQPTHRAELFTLASFDKAVPALWYDQAWWNTVSCTAQDDGTTNAILYVKLRDPSIRANDQLTLTGGSGRLYLHDKEGQKIGSNLGTSIRLQANGTLLDGDDNEIGTCKLQKVNGVGAYAANVTLTLRGLPYGARVELSPEFSVTPSSGSAFTLSYDLRLKLGSEIVQKAGSFEAEFNLSEGLDWLYVAYDMESAFAFFTNDGTPMNIARCYLEGDDVPEGAQVSLTGRGTNEICLNMHNAARYSSAFFFVCVVDAGGTTHRIPARFVLLDGVYSSPGADAVYYNAAWSSEIRALPHFFGSTAGVTAYLRYDDSRNPIPAGATVRVVVRGDVYDPELGENKTVELCAQPATAVNDDAQGSGKVYRFTMPVYTDREERYSISLRVSTWSSDTYVCSLYTEGVAEPEKLYLLDEWWEIRDHELEIGIKTELSVALGATRQKFTNPRLLNSSGTVVLEETEEGGALYTKQWSGYTELYITPPTSLSAGNYTLQVTLAGEDAPRSIPVTLTAAQFTAYTGTSTSSLDASCPYITPGGKTSLYLQLNSATADEVLAALGDRTLEMDVRLICLDENGNSDGYQYFGDYPETTGADLTWYGDTARLVATKAANKTVRLALMDDTEGGVELKIALRDTTTGHSWEFTTGLGDFCVQNAYGDTIGMLAVEAGAAATWQIVSRGDGTAISGFTVALSEADDGKGLAVSQSGSSFTVDASGCMEAAEFSVMITRNGCAYRYVGTVPSRTGFYTSMDDLSSVRPVLLPGKYYVPLLCEGGKLTFYLRGMLWEGEACTSATLILEDDENGTEMRFAGTRCDDPGFPGVPAFRFELRDMQDARRYYYELELGTAGDETGTVHGSFDCDTSRIAFANEWDIHVATYMLAAKPFYATSTLYGEDGYGYGGYALVTFDGEQLADGKGSKPGAAYYYRIETPAGIEVEHDADDLEWFRLCATGSTPKSGNAVVTVYRTADGTKVASKNLYVSADLKPGAFYNDKSVPGKTAITHANALESVTLPAGGEVTLYFRGEWLYASSVTVGTAQSNDGEFGVSAKGLTGLTVEAEMLEDSRNEESGKAIRVTLRSDGTPGAGTLKLSDCWDLGVELPVVVERSFSSETLNAKRTLLLGTDAVTLDVYELFPALGVKGAADSIPVTAMKATSSDTKVAAAALGLVMDERVTTLVVTPKAAGQTTISLVLLRVSDGTTKATATLTLDVVEQAASATLAATGEPATAGGTRSYTIATQPAGGVYGKDKVWQILYRPLNDPSALPRPAGMGFAAIQDTAAGGNILFLQPGYYTLQVSLYDPSGLTTAVDSNVLEETVYSAPTALYAVSGTLATEQNIDLVAIDPSAKAAFDETWPEEKNSAYYTALAAAFPAAVAQLQPSYQYPADVLTEYDVPTLTWQAAEGGVVLLTEGEGGLVNRALAVEPNTAKTVVTATARNGKKVTYTIRVLPVAAGAELTLAMPATLGCGQMDVPFAVKADGAEIPPALYDIAISDPKALSCQRVDNGSGEVMCLAAGNVAKDTAVTITVTLKGDPLKRKVTGKLTVQTVRIASMAFRLVGVDTDNQIDNGLLRGGRSWVPSQWQILITEVNLTDGTQLTGIDTAKFKPTFKSTDSTVAEAKKDGMLSVKGVGKCTILVTMNDSGKYVGRIRVEMNDLAPRLSNTAISFERATGRGEVTLYAPDGCEALPTDPSAYVLLDATGKTVVATGEGWSDDPASVEEGLKLEVKPSGKTALLRLDCPPKALAKKNYKLRVQMATGEETVDF